MTWLAELLWGNPHKFDSEEYKLYDTRRGMRNNMLLMMFLNFGNMFRDYGHGHLRWMPIWSNYVFIIAWTASVVFAIMYMWRMKQVGEDVKKLQMVKHIIEQ